MDIIINPKKIVLLWSFATFLLVVLFFLPYTNLDNINKVLRSIVIGLVASLLMYGFGIMAWRFIKKGETAKAFFYACCFIPFGLIVSFLKDGLWRLLSLNFSYIVPIGFFLTIFGCALVTILNKEAGRVNIDSATTPIQPSKLLGIKTAMWILGAVSGIATILTIVDIISSAISPPVPEFAGFEFIFLIPAMLFPLLAELPFLVFLLAKKNKQAIVLLIIQGFLLLILGGAILANEPLSEWFRDKNAKEHKQFMEKEHQKWEVEKEKFLSTPRVKNLALPTPETATLSFRPNQGDPYVDIAFTYPSSAHAQLFNIYKAENPNGPWTLISGDVPAYYNSVQDFNISENNKTIYYRIAVSDGNYNEGPYSPVSSVDLP